MKNIYMVQANIKVSGSFYLPYSVGCLAAYSFQFGEIKSNYKLCDFIFRKIDIEEALKQIENPYLMAFSSYMWNIDYNLDLAIAVKEKYPDCIIVFGGPTVPDDTEYLGEYPFIDILIHGEGEKPFYGILSTLLSDGDLSEVSDISFRRDGKNIKTSKGETEIKVIDYPSPYTEGYFDYIVNDKQYEGIQFEAVLETTRGCPYNCAYCSWGGKDKSFRKFPLQRVHSDLDWMAKNKIAFCMCADGNFGILDRDEGIADYVVELKKKYGYPEKFETIAAKNKDDLSFRINSKLEKVGLNRGVSVAVQSMTPEVLKNIGRENMEISKLAEQLKRYRNSGMYTYTDIILGLPGETLESFCKSVFDVMEAGQHCSINIFRLEYLPNTKMYTKEYSEKYKFKTIRTGIYQNHGEVSNGKYLASRSDVVVSTSTMPEEDWRTAMRISVCAQAFHCMGLLRFFSIYLRKAKNVSYYDFYMNIYKWIENESTVIKSILDEVCISIDTFLKKESGLYFIDKRFGNYYWYFDEGFFMLSIKEIDKFFEEASIYLKKYFDDENIFNELLTYQKEVLTYPGKEEKVIEFSYDWYDYFENMYEEDCLVPKEKKTKIRIGKSPVDNWESFGKEIVWYGRRDDKTVNKDVEVL